MNDIFIRFDEHTAYTRDWLEANDRETQRILARFKAKGISPVCECCDDRPGMYIAHRERYYLARNPGTGNRHAAHCPSFELADKDSGRTTYDSGVIRSRGDGTHAVKIIAPLSVNLAKSERIAGAEKDIDAKAPPIKKRSPTEKREGMSLSGLLAYLWELAELNRWAPGFAGKRHWGAVRHRLMNAAQQIYAKRHNLSEVLYLPEHFSPERVDEIERNRRESYDRIMKKTRSKNQFMVVIGRIRKINVNEGINIVTINLGHQGDNVKYYGGKHIVKKVENRPVVSIVNDEDESRLIYTMMLVARDENDALNIVDIGFLSTNMHMLPQYSNEDGRLTDKLIDEQRQFIKTMRFDGFKNTIYPEYFLVDVYGKPTPLTIFRPFVSETELAARIDAKRHWKEEYDRYWVWDIETEGETIPALPIPFGL